MNNPFAIIENRLDEIQEALNTLLEQKNGSFTFPMKDEREPARRKEAAKYLGVSESTLIRFEASGRLKRIPGLGKSVRYNWLELEQFRNQGL